LPKHKAVREELIKVLEVLLDDDDLHDWYRSLGELPEERRSSEFATVAARMKRAGEHPELVQATALLALPEVERAFRLTFEEASADR
jgi:hypothetical protein